MCKMILLSFTCIVWCVDVVRWFIKFKNILITFCWRAFRRVDSDDFNSFLMARFLFLIQSLRMYTSTPSSGHVKLKNWKRRKSLPQINCWTFTFTELELMPISIDIKLKLEFADSVYRLCIQTNFPWQNRQCFSSQIFIYRDLISGKEL